ncbi:hydrolase [Halobacteriales archaeon QS_3_64_16]|nr:MAG: hydrolase [Halobacteriales archaeon QS_3_64_16]
MGTPSSSSVVLVGGAVITVDDDRRVLDPGAIVVEDDRIAAVGDRDTILETYGSVERIDLRESVLLPGLIDSHGHAGHALTKNLANGTGDWLEVVRELYCRHADERFWRAESRLAALSRLRAGVTTSLSYVGSVPRVDNPKYALAAAEGYRELGLRHVCAVGPPGPPYPLDCRDPRTGEEITVGLDRAIETTRAVIDRLDGAADGRLSVCVALAELVPEFEDDGDATPPQASERSIVGLERVVELAEEHDLPIQAHCYGGQVEAAAKAVPEILSPSLSLAHCAGISEREIELLADNGVSASHGPLTHAYATARFPVIEALDAGLTVAISTDGAAPDRSFDLLSQARIAAQLQRAHFEDTSLLPAGKLIEAMTIDAAGALDLAEAVGSLEPGKQADVIALDARSARLYPRYALPQRIVHYATGGDVAFVMVDGRVRLRDGRPGSGTDEAVNEAAILEEADRVARDTFEGAGVLSLTESHPKTWDQVRY